MIDCLISKKDKDKFYQMINDKHIMGLHGGIIGDYNNDQCIVTLLFKWVPYLDEYGIKYIEMERYEYNYEIKYKEKLK